MVRSDGGEAPTGREHGGTMANIAVQRIKREFKEVLKSEEVGDGACQFAFRFPFLLPFDCELELGMTRR